MNNKPSWRANWLDKWNPNGIEPLREPNEEEIATAQAIEDAAAFFDAQLEAKAEQEHRASIVKHVMEAIEKPKD